MTSFQFHKFTIIYYFSTQKQINLNCDWPLQECIDAKNSCFRKFMKWCREQLIISACQKRRLNFGANISVSRRAAAATADQSKRNDTTFVLRSKQKVVKNLHHTKCWILLSLKKHLTLYFVFQILWPNKKRRILCTTFTKRQNPNGQIYSTEDSKIGVDCQNQRYIAHKQIRSRVKELE